MSIETGISWCDSTLNLMMGCDGCELWNPAKGIRHCYAGSMTERYKGRAGWPVSFATPTIFDGRLKAALRWPDLTGKPRGDKPWLNGYPRLIFLNDMGDTFTESLPYDWLAPYLPAMADSPHVWMLLTKRGSRMVRFFDDHEVPANVWPGVTVTSSAIGGAVQISALLAFMGDRWRRIRTRRTSNAASMGALCARSVRGGRGAIFL